MDAYATNIWLADCRLAEILLWCVRLADESINLNTTFAQIKGATLHCLGNLLLERKAHCLKNCRNTLVKNDIEYETGKFARWRDFEKF